MERDLLVQTGYNLDDVGGALPWSALGAFLHRVEPGGAIAYELDPETAAFSSTIKTNAILADIYDLLAQINANIVAGFSRKRTQKPKRYPRPNDESKKRIGKESMTISELNNWLDKKKRQRGGGTDGERN